MRFLSPLLILLCSIRPVTGEANRLPKWALIVIICVGALSLVLLLTAICIGIVCVRRRRKKNTSQIGTSGVDTAVAETEPQYVDLHALMSETEEEPKMEQSKGSKDDSERTAEVTEVIETSGERTAEHTETREEADKVGTASESVGVKQDTTTASHYEDTISKTIPLDLELKEDPK